MSKTAIIIGVIAVVGIGGYIFYRKTRIPKLTNLRTNASGIAMVDVDGQTLTFNAPYNLASTDKNDFSVSIITDATGKVTGAQIAKNGSMRDAIYL